MQDGNGIELKVGDRVHTYDIFIGDIVHGTLLYNDDGSDYPYYVAYDDGEEFKVLSFSGLYKSDN